MFRVLSFLLAMCWAGGALSVAAETPADYAQDLAAAATQRATLERIRDLADPAFRDLLQALKEGALYSWPEGLLIFTDDGVFVDLAGTPLLDDAGEAIFPDEVEQVPLEEENIPLVQRALDVIDLFAAAPNVRRSTALRLGNMQDVSLIAVLQKATETEEDAAVRTVLVEAVYKLQLFSPHAETRRRAVAYFGDARSEAALSRLRDMRQDETDAGVRAAVVGAITTIENFLLVRNSVGYIFNGVSLSSILLIMSLGLAITFGLMGIINMAHGEMLMIGSYTAYVLQELFTAYLPGYLDYYFILALPLSVVTAGLRRPAHGARHSALPLWPPTGKPAHHVGHRHGAATGGAALFRRSNERQPADLVPRRLGSHAGAHFPLQPGCSSSPCRRSPWSWCTCCCTAPTWVCASAR